MRSFKMKIGVISDTHLQEVTSELVRMYEEHFSAVDMLLHAGDLVSMDIVDFLSQKPLHIVQGNMDCRAIKDRFAEKEVIQVNGFRLGLIHGWGSPVGIEKRIRPEFGEVHAIVYGHSHRSANHIRDGVLFFNPGTACGFALPGSHSIGILDIAEEIQGTIIRV
jgi:putative phosphoesterase